MKIGIMTFHRAINYGAFLQAYALKNFLIGLGHQVQIIDYWPKEHAELYNYMKLRVSPAAPLLLKVKQFFHFILGRKKAKQKISKFRLFQEKYLDAGPKVLYEKAEDLTKINYDLIIYGSDQIWWKSDITNYTGYDFVYWGDFVPNKIKKITYAVSMGIMKVSEDELSILNEKIKNFSSISIRENNLYNLLKKLHYYNPSISIDPVFLIKRDTWNNLCKKIKVPQQYVLLFNLTGSIPTEKIAKKIAKKKKLPLVEITPRIRPSKFKKNYFQTCDPFEFLYLIKNSEFVITSSFHCTAFSIIFSKQFLSAGMGNNSDRVASLLNELNIKNDHICINNNICDPSQIDYNEVNSILNVKISLSEKYLRESIA